MKTLIITYLPNGQHSGTRQLLESFLQNVPQEGREVVDLLQQPAPIFDYDTLQAYQKRHFLNQPLSLREEALLASRYRLIEQLRSAHQVVLAYPMHNFSQPAAVKAYIDAVTFQGLTYAPGQSLLKGKKVLTIFTSGIDFSHDRPEWDVLTPLINIQFKVMGFSEIEVVNTSLTRPDNFEPAAERLRQLAQRWFQPCLI